MPRSRTRILPETATCLLRQPGATPTGTNSLEAVTPGAADHVNRLVLVDYRFDLACQLCGRPLLDTSLGLNFSLVLQGLLCNLLVLFRSSGLT